MLAVILIVVAVGMLLWALGGAWLDAGAGGFAPLDPWRSRPIGTRAKRWIAAAVAIGICVYGLELYWLGLI